MNENEVKKEIKKTNKKALPFFITIIVVGFIVGFISGISGGSFSPDKILVSIQDGSYIFFKYVTPIIIPVSIISLYIPSKKKFKKAKALYEKLKETDNEDLEYDIDNIINKANIYLEVNTMIAVVVSGLNIWCNRNTDNLFIMVITSLEIIISCAISFGLLKKMTDFTMLKNPNMKISVFESTPKKFKKMYEYSDECEKAIIGKAAYKAMSYVTYSLVIIFVLSMISIIFFNKGIIMLITSVALLLILEITFIKESNKQNVK